MTTIAFSKDTGDWRHRSACLTSDPDLFFPASEHGSAALQVAKAKSTCAICPVQEKCLRWALGTQQTVGIWGGKTELERAALKRREAARAAEDLRGAEHRTPRPHRRSEKH